MLKPAAPLKELRWCPGAGIRGLGPQLGDTSGYLLDVRPALLWGELGRVPVGGPSRKGGPWWWCLFLAGRCWVVEPIRSGHALLEVRPQAVLHQGAIVFEAVGVAKQGQVRCQVFGRGRVE